MSWYRTGTIALTNGSATVTGTGTDWLTGAAVGEGLLAPDGKVYEVYAIASATSITLGSVYLGSTASGQAYAIMPSQSYIRTLAAQAATLVNSFQNVADTVGSGKFPDGIVGAPGIAWVADTDTGVRRTGTNAMAVVAGGVDQAVVDTNGLSVQDGKLRITGSADATKIAVFEVDGFTTATTRTMTLPNVSTTLVGQGTALGTPSSATLTNATGLPISTGVAGLGTGVATFLATPSSTNLAAAVTGETGTGALVFGTTPTLDRPTLSTEAVTVTTNNLPALHPSLNLDFANGRTVDPRIAFTRASTATRVNAKGLIETVASGAPRIDYDPVTLACKGLLIEEARTNLLTYSEQFDNAVWTKTRASITANAVTAPDGTTTADKLVEDSTASNAHFANQSSVVTNPNQYTKSIYLKAGERTVCDVITASGTATFSAISVNLSAGTIGAPLTSGLPSALSSSTIQALQNGWYRVTMNFVGSSAGFSGVQVRLTNGTTDIYTGDGTSGLYIWGAQLEAGAFATSYIPTTSAQVTRAADVASMTGGNFSNWYRQDEGTFVAASDQYVTGNSTQCTVFETGDGTNANIVQLGTQYGSTNFQYLINQANSGQVAFITAASTSATLRAVGYKLNDCAQSINGGAVSTDTVAVIPTVTSFAIGCKVNQTSQLNGHIARLAYFPKRLTNAELEALSA